MLGDMETLPRRSNNQIQDLDRSQKSQIFYESTEVKSKAS